MARLQSKVSSGLAGLKGSLQQNVGDEAPTQKANWGEGNSGQDARINALPDNSQFQQGPGLDAVPSTNKGASLSQHGQRGQVPELPGSSPLQGHSDSLGGFNQVSAEATGPTILSGNHNPKRSPGKKSVSNAAMAD